MPRVIWLLIAGRAVNRVGAFSLAFLVLLLTQERGWSTGDAGLAMAGFGVATIPSRLLGGRWADRLGRRTTIVLGLSGCAASQLGLAGFSSDAGVIGSVLALGLCYEIYEPASQALVADTVPADLQLRAHGALTAALAGAGALAGGLAVLLASLDLRWLFVADAASCLAAAVFLGVLLPGGRPRPRRATDLAEADVDPGVASPWRDPRLLRLVLAQTVFACVYLQSTVALPLTVQARGLGAEVVGGLMGVAAVTMIVAQPLLGPRRLGSWSPRRRLGLGFAVMAVGLTGYADAGHVSALVVASIVVALGDLVLLGQLLTLGSNLAPAHLRARYLAVLGTSWGFAAIAAPLAGTALIDHVGTAATWSVLAVVCLGLGTTARRWLPSPDKPTQDPGKASSVAACAASPSPKPLIEPRPSPSRRTTSIST